jgi:hypothetical protein
MLVGMTQLKKSIKIYSNELELQELKLLQILDGIMLIGKKTTTLPYHTKMVGGHSKFL